MSELELSALLEPHKADLRKLAENFLAGDHAKFVSGTAALLGAIATGNPTILALAPFAERAVSAAFASAADKRVTAELERMRVEEEREAFVATIADTVEALLGQAVLQLIRTQHRVKEDVLDQLGGIRADLSQFRDDFQRGLAADQIYLNVQHVLDGALGLRVSPGARERVFIGEQIVTGPGSVGIVLGS